MLSMPSSKIKCYIIYLLLMFKMVCSINDNTLLIVVSFDGFRYDYIDRHLSKNMVSLKRNSSHATYMLSVFPTKTFPNHFSIGTGLYTEVHGVLDNKIYIHATNQSVGYSEEMFHYNKDVVPIWTLNERGGGGRRSGVMMWPGGNFAYQNTSPSFTMVFNETYPWKSRVDTLISWFTDAEKPINFGMLYFEEPDLICHSYGPDSEQVNAEISHADQIVQYLLTKVEEAGLLPRLNLVLLSDHGGQSVKVPENIINLNNFLDQNSYHRDGVAPNLQIYPVYGKEVEVLEALRGARAKGGNFSTYTKAEMLDRWHYKNCDRTPPILVTADVGYLFQNPNHIHKINSTVIGTHGYDPLVPTMRAFFMAMGPAFKQNYEVEPFENINIYPLVAHLLGLQLPDLRPNGSLNILQNILVSQPSTSETFNKTVLVSGLLIAVAVLVVLGYILYRWHRSRKAEMRKASTASYRVLNQHVEESQDQELSECEDEPPT